ncbi:MAG: hypothetical protein QM484_04950 [Woeseiaceae bacterium]
MLSKEVIIFNTFSLIVTLGLCAVFFSYAAVPDAKRLAAKQPQAIEKFSDINLGSDYGDVSVAELMGYYIESPPVQLLGEAPKREHFGGC